MDIICINGTFSSEFLLFAKQNNIQTPEEGKMYSARDFMTTVDGKKGLWLNEIVNPKVPIFHPILSKKMLMEPSFSVDRFAKLNGDSIESSDIKEVVKSTSNS